MSLSNNQLMATIGALFGSVSAELVNLFSRKSIVEDLIRHVEKLNTKEEEVSRKAAAEKDDGKIIKDQVPKWQQEVENIKTHVYKLTKQRQSWKNSVFRFRRLGKKAAKLSESIAELIGSGVELLANEISFHPPKDYMPIFDTTYQHFGSREEAHRKLWNALVDEDGDPILGLYGMPGVGKTLMTEVAWKYGRDERVFDKVTRAIVGPEINVIKLQDQLAGYLDCRFESKDNEQHRASQLKNSLMNGGKSLVILDNVWDVIPLKYIGVPVGDGGSRDCKILLTCRSEDVCLHNNCINPIEIKTLTESEAWEMFKNVVGTSKIDSLQDAFLAAKVCKQCANLPLLIHAVGVALKFATKNSWEDALYQLENGRFEVIDGRTAQVYATLQMSFEKLRDGEKICLFLCSLFPKDAEIEIQMLFDLATGSQLIDRGRNIYGLIDILKSSSLLIQGRDDYTVKMNDIIRDVGRSIAARDPKYAFIYIRCNSWFPDIDDSLSPKLLHLDLVGENVRFPDDLAFPDLHTMWLRCNNHSQQHLGDLISAFTNLRFLLLKDMSFSLQELSIGKLHKLRVLTLDGCYVHQTLLSSISKSLRTLCISECHLPSPLDLPELRNLRRLELISRAQIEMLPKVISCLSSIEEVNIPGGYRTWDDAATSISAAP